MKIELAEYSKYFMLCLREKQVHFLMHTQVIPYKKISKS